MIGKLFSQVNGRCRVLITGTDTETVLNRCSSEGIDILYARKKDQYSLLADIKEAQLKALEGCSRRCMCDCELIETKGGSRFLEFLKNHVWLFASFFAAVVIVFASSLFIWDIRVVGNEKLTDGEILRALSRYGVDIGAYRPKIKNDAVRNNMLLTFPELAWMSVNISSSRAAVLISERPEKPEIYEKDIYTDVVAKTDGIIRSVCAENGTVLVSRGQAVTKGEKLIDGIVESITAPAHTVNASGTVNARTKREIKCVSPSEISIKAYRAYERNRYAFVFGKTRINFYFNAGNTVDECDKIVHNYKIGKKGVFSLPITLVHERILPYRTVIGVNDSAGEMAERSLEGIREEIDGEILSESVSQSTDGGLVTVTVSCECLENIAETVKR